MGVEQIDDAARTGNGCNVILLFIPFSIFEIVVFRTFFALTVE